LSKEKDMARFKIGNKEAEKWTEDAVYDIFSRMLKVAESDDNVLCMQDVLKHPDIKLYRSGLDYLVGKFPDFGKYKRDIQDVIISRVNRGAIKGDFAGTPAIFRMKQLGEEDRTTVDSNVNANINGFNVKDIVKFDRKRREEEEED
jgi:hypothetical protein